MIEWSEQHLLIRDMVRRFVEAEIKPRLGELEHGDTPPYDVLRKMMQAFDERRQFVVSELNKLPVDSITEVPVTLSPR